MFGRLSAFLARVAKLRYRFMAPAPGSAAWLVKKEIEFGGLVTNVPRVRVSPLDPRTPAQLKQGGMIGGDRMYDHGYAQLYAEHLSSFKDAAELVIAEFGILKGTGLALWCELYPTARILGFDIDPEHFKSNRAELVARGAFARNAPEVYVYDQLMDGTQVIRDALKGQTLDVVIDDGLHTPEAIIMTFESVKQFLSPRFVYFIEDYEGLFDTYAKAFAGYELHSFGRMNIILPATQRTTTA